MIIWTESILRFLKEKKKLAKRSTPLHADGKWSKVAHKTFLECHNNKKSYL